MADQNLGEYAQELLGTRDDLLDVMRQEASERGVPEIQVPWELGRLLQLLIVQTRARHVLEIGTLFGYSGILMARVLPDDGTLVTLEVEPLHASLARQNFERAKVAQKLEIREGPALDSLAALAGSNFDLVFIDADKQAYPQYLEWALKLTHPGSIIVADNVWREGSILDPPADDAGGQGIAEFNRMMAASPSLISTIIPTRDGTDAASLSVVRTEPIS